MKKISVFCAALTAGFTFAVAAAEPFTMIWIHGVSYTPKGEDGRDHPPPEVIADALGVFGSGIPEYKVEGIRGQAIMPVGRGSGYRRRTMPYAVRHPSPPRSKPYGFTNLFPNPALTIDSPYARSGKPFFIYERMSRPPFFLPRDGAPLADRASYEEWKKAHPGFVAFNSLWELDSDCEGFHRGCDNIADESLKKELQEAFPRNCASGMADRVAWARKSFKLAEDFHFGEKRIWPLCSLNVGYEHIFGAFGATGLWYESTGQHVGAWGAGAAFARGAARQRGLDFGWYMAHYRVGHGKNRKVRKGDRGVSLTLHRRQILLGWLSGAKYLKTEGWPKLYLEKKDGKWAPTDYARELDAIYDVSSKVERGEPFTPLAVLTPLKEPCDSNYVRRNWRLLDPKSQTDVFDTLIPIRGDNGVTGVNWGLGEQGCMYNSEFAAFFDSLCPDSGQDSAAFAKALSRYRHALIVSDRFDKKKFDSATLAAFEKAGGKVHRYPSPGCDTKEKLRELLLKIQDETMPVKVEGDIQWGVNKTSKGWLVWLINNKGVVSYFGEPEEFNASRTAKVKVTVKATGETLEAVVPPGDYRLLEIPDRVTGNAANPDAIDLYPTPVPAEMKVDIDRPVAFDASATVVADCPAPEAVAWLRRNFAAWFGADKAPVVKAGVSGLKVPEGEEAYAVSADASGVKIAARSLAGVRWAAYTLRQLSMAKRGTFRTEGRILPTLAVSDRPHLKFRAVHLCWFPETKPSQIERAIRLAALLKFNHAIIEPWGTYASKRHPWWSWPGAAMTKAEIRRLVAIGRELGITLVPQINVYGHASASRTSSLKHVALDFRPEYEPLFEPGGWNWCISNPETQRVLRDLVAEIHEDFGNPPYFHLGCDEAQPPSCPECRKTPYGERVCRHIADLAEFVKKRGARPMIWHDMLLARGDPRWKGFKHYGSETTATLADTLPKDVVICDWEYTSEVHEEWPTMAYFREKGFSVAGCPWVNTGSMKAMADYVAKIGGFGFIETTWHRMRGRDWVKMFRFGSAAAWGTPVRKIGKHDVLPQFDTEFALLLRMVGHDMKVSDYFDTGHLNHQIPPDWWIDN